MDVIVFLIILFCLLVWWFEEKISDLESRIEELEGEHYTTLDDFAEDFDESGELDLSDPAKRKAFKKIYWKMLANLPPESPRRIPILKALEEIHDVERPFFRIRRIWRAFIQVLKKPFSKMKNP